MFPDFAAALAKQHDWPTPSSILLLSAPFTIPSTDLPATP